LEVISIALLLACVFGISNQAVSGLSAASSELVLDAAGGVQSDADVAEEGDSTELKKFTGDALDSEDVDDETEADEDDEDEEAEESEQDPPSTQRDTCNPVSKGTCRFLSCASKWGPTQCIGGFCLCSQGNCATQQGVCTAVPPAPKVRDVDRQLDFNARLAEYGKFDVDQSFWAPATGKEKADFKDVKVSEKDQITLKPDSGWGGRWYVSKGVASKMIAWAQTAKTKVALKKASDSCPTRVAKDTEVNPACTSGAMVVDNILKEFGSDYVGVPSTAFNATTGFLARLTGLQKLKWCNGLMTGTWFSDEAGAADRSDAGLAAMWIPEEKFAFWSTIGFGIESFPQFCGGASFKAAFSRACSPGINFMSFIQLPSGGGCAVDSFGPIVSAVAKSKYGFAFGLSSHKLLGGTLSLVVPEVSPGASFPVVARSKVDARAHLALGVSFELDIADVLNLPALFSKILVLTATAIVAVGFDGLPASAEDVAPELNQPASNLGFGDFKGMSAGIAALFKNKPSAVAAAVKVADDAAKKATSTAKSLARVVGNVLALTLVVRATVDVELNLGDITNDMLSNIQLAALTTQFLVKTSPANSAYEAGRSERLSPGLYFYAEAAVSLAPIKWLLTGVASILQWLGIDLSVKTQYDTAYAKMDAVAKKVDKRLGFYFGGYITTTGIGLRIGFTWGERDFELWCRVSWGSTAGGTKANLRSVVDCQSSVISTLATMLWDGGKYALQYAGNAIASLGRAALRDITVATRLTVKALMDTCRWFKQRFDKNTEKFGKFCPKPGATGMLAQSDEEYVLEPTGEEKFVENPVDSWDADAEEAMM